MTILDVRRLAPQWLDVDEVTTWGVDFGQELRAGETVSGGAVQVVTGTAKVASTPSGPWGPTATGNVQLGRQVRFAVKDAERGAVHVDVTATTTDGQVLRATVIFRAAERVRGAV